MPFQSTKLATEISKRLHSVADQLKTRTRASFTDANHSLEYVMARFFNTLFGWKLINLNNEQPNFPAADRGDRSQKLAMQITNENAGTKISETAEKAMKHAASHGFGTDFTELIIFFLLPQKPSTPKAFTQPADLKLTTWDLKDLLEKMHALENIAALEEALRILKEEMCERNSPDPHPIGCDLESIRKAIDHYEQQLILFREIGDRRGECNTLSSLASAYWNSGELRKVHECHEHALVAFREIGDRHGEAATLNNLGNLLFFGDTRKAIEYYDQEMLILREIGNRRQESYTLICVGQAYAESGDADQAIEYHEQALAIAREIGDRPGEGSALLHSAMAYKTLGNLQEAVARATVALAISEAHEPQNVHNLQYIRIQLAAWTQG
jgi:tetratricopeptide (TPR) repeat protein